MNKEISDSVNVKGHNLAYVSIAFFRFMNSLTTTASKTLIHATYAITVGTREYIELRVHVTHVVTHEVKRHTMLQGVLHSRPETT